MSLFNHTIINDNICYFSVYGSLLYYTETNLNGMTIYNIDSSSCKINDREFVYAYTIDSIDPKHIIIESSYNILELPRICIAISHSFDEHQNVINNVDVYSFITDGSGIPIIQYLNTITSDSGDLINCAYIEPSGNDFILYYDDKDNILSVSISQLSSTKLSDYRRYSSTNNKILTLYVKNGNYNGSFIDTSNNTYGFYINNNFYFSNTIDQPISGSGIITIGSTAGTWEKYARMHYFACGSSILAINEAAQLSTNMYKFYTLDQGIICGMIATEILNNNFALFSIIIKTDSGYSIGQLDSQLNFTIIQKNYYPIVETNIPLNIVNYKNTKTVIYHKLIGNTGNQRLDMHNLSSLENAVIQINGGATPLNLNTSSSSFAPSYDHTNTVAIVPTINFGYLYTNLFHPSNSSLLCSFNSSNSNVPTNNYPTFLSTVCSSPNTDIHAFDNFGSFYHFQTNLTSGNNGQNSSTNYNLTYTIKALEIPGTAIYNIRSASAFNDNTSTYILTTIAGLENTGFQTYNYDNDTITAHQPTKQYADGTNINYVSFLKYHNDNIIGIDYYPTSNGYVLNFFYSDYKNVNPYIIKPSKHGGNYPIGLDIPANLAPNLHAVTYVDSIKVNVFVDGSGGMNRYLCFNVVDHPDEESYVAYIHHYNIICMDATYINGCLNGGKHCGFIIAFLDELGDIYQYDGTINGGPSILMYSGYYGENARLVSSGPDNCYFQYSNSANVQKMLSFIPVQSPLVLPPPWVFKATNYISPVIVNGKQTMPYNASLIDGYQYGLVGPSIGDDMALFYTYEDKIIVGPMQDSNSNYSVPWKVFKKNSNFIIHGYNFDITNNYISYFTSYIALQNVGYTYKAWIPITNPQDNYLTMNPSVSYYFEVSVIDNSGGIATGFNCDFNVVCVANCQPIYGYTGNETANDISYNLFYIPQVINRFPVVINNKQCKQTITDLYSIEYGITSGKNNDGTYYWRMSFFAEDIYETPYCIFDCSYNLHSSNTQYDLSYNYMGVSLVLGKQDDNSLEVILQSIDVSGSNSGMSPKDNTFPIIPIKIYTLADTDTFVNIHYSFLLGQNCIIPVLVFNSVFMSPAVSIFAASNYSHNQPGTYFYSVPVATVSFNTLCKYSTTTDVTCFGYEVFANHNMYVNNIYSMQLQAGNERIDYTCQFGNAEWFPSPDGVCQDPWGQYKMVGHINSNSDESMFDRIIYVRINPAGSVSVFNSEYKGQSSERTLWTLPPFTGLQNINNHINFLNGSQVINSMKNTQPRSILQGLADYHYNTGCQWLTTDLDGLQVINWTQQRTQYVNLNQHSAFCGNGHGFPCDYWTDQVPYDYVCGVPDSPNSSDWKCPAYNPNGYPTVIVPPTKFQTRY